MAFSNSFHSSAKKHSIGSASKLGSVEAHNERGFSSARYSANKTQLIQGSLGLAANVQDAINDIFQPYIDEYNQRQKRKDRKIEESAFEHFCNNKKLDIAAEAVYQIGDKEFWARWRTDEVVGRRKGKDIVRHSYPPEVVAVMSEIYRRQMDAYESIYQTHGKEILEKIQLHYDRCQDTLNLFRASLDYDRYAAIAEMPTKGRESAVAQLSEEELLAYTEFADAYHSAKDIEKRQYRERILKGQMHIRNIQGVSHFDEWSAHAHGVSICWTDGYRNGLSSRVAKAVVLNRFALEVIQDRLHEIAQEEIAKHPEIFEREHLKEKGVGRNMDYTTEQIARQKQQELLAENEELLLRRSRLTGEVGLMEIQKASIGDAIDAAQATAADLQEQNTALAAQLAAGREELAGICKIKTMVERDHVADEAQHQLDELQSAYGLVDDFYFEAMEDKECGAFNWRKLMEDFLFEWGRMRVRIDELISSIKEKIRDIGIFEWKQKVAPENRVAGILQERLEGTLAGAWRRSDTEKNNQEISKKDVTFEPSPYINK